PTAAAGGNPGPSDHVGFREVAEQPRSGGAAGGDGTAGGPGDRRQPRGGERVERRRGEGWRRAGAGGGVGDLAGCLRRGDGGGRAAGVEGALAGERRRVRSGLRAAAWVAGAE